MELSWLENVNQLTLALNHLRSALGLLDAASAPAQIGAHVDTAIHQLQDALASAAARPDGPGQIETNADPQ